tara:strand:+ start:898 stop:1341 length:444 start_codon:yes stop_codon:yes gene_type:complete
MKVVVVSGGFDPVHSGHIFYLLEAKKFGDRLIVALNSDEWLIKKKGKEFMPFEERKIILENLICVDQVIDFEDDDLGSCINALKSIKKMFPNDEIIFANGGDRNKENIPEMTEEGIQFLFGIGGNFKRNSSSSILDEWVDFAQKNKG